jgi:murein DD-endopeptidase MepM/ murein hydrolase activator NlpD
MTNDTRVIQFRADQRVRVRTRPSLSAPDVTPDSTIALGATVTAPASSRTTADGYIWIQHAKGWSAERSVDGKTVFLTMTGMQNAPTPPAEPKPVEPPKPVDPPKPVEPKPAEPKPATIIYRALNRVRTRTQPSLSAPDVVPDSTLALGETFTIDRENTVVADGYIWIKHPKGWSAIRSVNGAQVFLQVTKQENTQPQPNPQPPPSERVEFQATEEVRFRATPGLSGTPLGWLAKNEKVMIDPASRTQTDGFIWVKHNKGWSAERSIVGGIVYLAKPLGAPEIGTSPHTHLPHLKTLIKRLPVNIEQTNYFQYFGNNVFAYTDGKNFNYDGYSQGLHGGLDFLNTATGVPVYAGVEATYINVRWNSPNRSVWLKVGDYTLIYQHITNPRPFKAGDKISPDTVIAEIEPLPWYHLHFEIRYQETWIVNPLLLMQDHLVNQIVGKFHPNKASTGGVSQLSYFYKTPSWTKWTLPLDQPLIRLGGPVVGPRGR